MKFPVRITRHFKVEIEAFTPEEAEELACRVYGQGKVTEIPQSYEEWKADEPPF